jgi:hypothetical protein
MSARIFYFSTCRRKDDFNTLTIEKRSSPASIQEMLSIPMTNIYIECRCLHTLKANCRGALCALNQGSSWKLVVILDLCVRSDTYIHYLEWKGGVNHPSLLPHFFDQETDDFCSGGWRISFNEKVSWGKKEIKFLNLCYGLRPFSKTFVTLVGKDGCLKASLDHPDQWPIPYGSSLHIRSLDRLLKSPPSWRHHPLYPPIESLLIGKGSGPVTSPPSPHGHVLNHHYCLRLAKHYT